MEHTIRIVHETHEEGEDPGLWENVDEVTLEGPDVRRFRAWLDQSLRMNPSSVIHGTLHVAGRAVWGQAYELGRHDALESGYNVSVQHMAPLWRDGYDAGFAAGAEEAALNKGRNV